MSHQPKETFQAAVAEGQRRLERKTPELLATGAVGGLDVGTGVLALLVVKQATGNSLLAALAFSIGFIALTLAGSELFTENFLVPVAALAARKTKLQSIGRLWGGTLVSNLIGGWVLMGIVMIAFPKLHPVAVEIGSSYTKLGIGWVSFAGALLGGVVITLMTWMEQGTDSVPARLLCAIIAAFILAAAPLNHVIVVSLEMFAALQAGAHFGYLDWLGMSAWFGLGNIIGGVGLVTVLRLIQVR
ncbi:MAG: formate-nitrite transporter family protein [Actinomycetota bacterium]|nr:formate-nitrite transporter family protein [Actinomycetota bacterium]